MTKTALLACSLVPLLAASALAQTPAADRPPRVISLPPPPKAATPAPESGAAPADDGRFDLKFPGGKVKEFVAAVAKVLGRPVNVVIPQESEDTVIPAVDVSKVTVRSLFRALSNASQREVTVPVAGPAGMTNYQRIMVGYAFKSEDANPDTVWTFQAITAPTFPAPEPPPTPTPQRVVQYFPVAEYLMTFSLEDITAAIEAGWTMLNGPVNPPPSIRFHEETKLLICAGTPMQVELVPQVLAGLSRSRSALITQKMQSRAVIKAKALKIGPVTFTETPPAAILEAIRNKAKDQDPEHSGIDVVLKETDAAGPLQKINLTLLEVSAMEALERLAAVSGLKLEIHDAVILLIKGTAAPSSANTAPAPSSVSPRPPGSDRTVSPTNP